MKRVACFGAGGHAKVVLDALALTASANEIELVGIVAPSMDADLAADHRHLGEDSELSSIVAAHRVSHFVIGIGSIRGNTAIRTKLFDLAVGAGLEPLTVMHPSAIVARSVNIGPGSAIMAGAVLQAGVHVGRNVIINTRASIDHDSRVGDHAHIAPGAICSGNVAIGENAHIGTGAVIVQGITIGSGATVGAGAVVVKDCPNGATIYGVPAREKTAGRPETGG